MASRGNLSAAQVAAIEHVDFRGAEIPRLAERVRARFGGGSPSLNAATLGRAFRSDPCSWADWGSGANTLQHLKYLWHAIVRFGRTPQGRG